MKHNLTDLAHFNAGIERARADYQAHPAAFTGRHICPKCIWPYARQNCDHCRTVARMRAHRAKEHAA